MFNLRSAPHCDGSVQALPMRHLAQLVMQALVGQRCRIQHSSPPPHNSGAARIDEDYGAAVPCPAEHGQAQGIEARVYALHYTHRAHPALRSMNIAEGVAGTADDHPTNSDSWRKASLLRRP